jgi:hypothetical protein
MLAGSSLDTLPGSQTEMQDRTAIIGQSGYKSGDKDLFPPVAKSSISVYFQ